MCVHVYLYIDIHMYMIVHVYAFFCGVYVRVHPDSKPRVSGDLYSRAAMHSHHSLPKEDSDGKWWYQKETTELTASLACKQFVIVIYDHASKFLCSEFSSRTQLRIA